VKACDWTSLSSWQAAEYPTCMIDTSDYENIKKDQQETISFIS
jgi:hypothetical protein